MELILKEDIIGLGYKNDIVNVKSGYGRNYLIPQGKAVIASPSAKKVLAENLKQQASKLAALKAEAEKKGEAIKDVALTIAAKPTRMPPPSVRCSRIRLIDCRCCSSLISGKYLRISSIFISVHFLVRHHSK